MGAPRSVRLSIYLLKDAAASPGSALQQAKALSSHRVAVDGQEIGLVYVEPQHAHPPSWARLFEDADLPNSALPSVAGASAVFLVPAAGRTFALTLGYGRHLLQPGSWEERFGLLTTVNAIEPESLRSIDRKSFDENVRHTREQLTRRASIAAFGFNVEQDLLQAVTGVPGDETLGSVMSGMDALSVSVAIDLIDLPDLLAKYLALSQQTTYRKSFPWIDHISEVRDAVLIAQLETKLIGQMQSSPPERTWLAIPEVVDLADVAGFRYGTSRKRELYGDLYLADLLAYIGNAEPLTIETLRNAHVNAFSASADQIVHTWSAFRCLYGEITLGSHVHVLSSGKWYRVSKSFANDVGAFYTSLPRASITMPAYDDANEGDYNQRACDASAGKLLLFDKKLVRTGPPRGGIEFCDIMTGKSLIHVKRYGASAVLSHLFSQGLVSGELFSESRAFRDEVNKKLPPGRKIADTAPRPSGYEIVYAIISRSQKPLEIPFFSKVNLRAAAQRLLGRGYAVSIKQIESTQ